MDGRFVGSGMGSIVDELGTCGGRRRLPGGVTIGLRRRLCHRRRAGGSDATSGGQAPAVP